MAGLRKYRRGLLVAAGVGGLLAVALWPRAVDVDVATVTRGPLTVTIDEDGDTRVHHRFVVSAPLAGRVERIDLDPGDPVHKGVTVVARLRPEAAQLLDARSRAEAAAAVDAARAVAGRTRAEEQRARAAFDLAAADLTREEALSASGLTTRQALETRRSAVVAARESVSAAGFASASAAADLERARARLLPSALDAGGRVVTVLAPVDGVVLRRFLDSESVVAPGARLLEIGDPSHIEIVADLLSSDAVKVKPGTPGRVNRRRRPLTTRRASVAHRSASAFSGSTSSTTWTAPWRGSSGRSTQHLADQRIPSPAFISVACTGFSE